MIENTATEQKNEISVLKSDYQKLVEDHTKLLRKDELQLNYNETNDILCCLRFQISSE